MHISAQTLLKTCRSRHSYISSLFTNTPSANILTRASHLSTTYIAPDCQEAASNPHSLKHTLSITSHSVSSSLTLSVESKLARTQVFRIYYTNATPSIEQDG